MRKESTSLALSLLLLIGCPYVSIDDLDARMDLDGDGVPRPEDCDDDDPEVSEAMTWYADGDGDGWGGASTASACALPSGFSSVGGDCDDADPSVHPDAVELCNEQDDDCDGDVDEGQDLPTWYLDADQDGYGDDDSASQACTAPDGWIAQGEDCDDSDAAVNPGAEELCNGIDDDCDTVVDDGLEIPTWYADADHDGYGDPAVSEQACAAPSGYVSVAEDCDDGDDEVHPGAAERCNEIDDDCDEQVDEGLDIPTWYRDADEDGYGDPEFSSQACSVPSGYVGAAGDCDDLDPQANPGELERCDDFDTDEDCDGLADDADSAALGTVTTYQDLDGDGFGVDDTTSQACDLSAGWALVGGDCDDGDVERHPDVWWYRDADEDGYGDAANGVRSCGDVVGYVRDDQDCDDARGDVHPGAQEVCVPGGLDDDDEDCDGLIDDDDGSVLGQVATYWDADSDGYGETASEQFSCELPSGWVWAGGDCDDTEPAASPSEVETCDDLLDNDCDGEVDCDDVNCSGTEACGYFSADGADLTVLGSTWFSMLDNEVIWVGDQTGDGLSDLLITSNVGESAFIVDGTSRGVVDVELAAVATIADTESSSDFGTSASGLGDIDGDGWDDFAVSARGSSIIEYHGGAFYVFLGPVSGSLTTSDAAGSFYGDVYAASYGSTLVGTADVTGDGIADALLSTSEGPGVPVVSGSDLLGTGAIGEVAITLLGHINLYGLDLGDLDGDGVADVLASGNSAHIYTGPISSSTTASTDFASTSMMGNCGSASCGGDLDGDGNADLVLGAKYGPSGGGNEGVVSVFMGPFGASVDASSDYAAQILGAASGDNAGTEVEIVDDLDDDGFGDLLVSAPYADEGGVDAGTIYVFLGPVSGGLSTTDAEVKLVGDMADAEAGWALSASVDADADGHPDLLFTASEAQSSDKGAAYLFLGSRF